jgi:hypothetical protein
MGETRPADRRHDGRRLARGRHSGYDIGVPIHEDVTAYNLAQREADRAICDALARQIDASMTGADNRIWHRHPVWFIDGNPIVGYSKLKESVRLLFWSGQTFNEPGLQPEGSFKAAEARFTSVDDIDTDALARWLEKAQAIQWDYKNIVKRRGVLERLR